MFARSIPVRRLTLMLATAFLAAGCGGGDDAGDAGAAGGGDQPAESSVDPATAGSLAGTVSFTGTPPAPRPIDMDEEPVCAEKYTEPPTTQTVLVGDGGGLGNVFVYIREGLTGHTFPTPEPAVIDQDGCRYRPHVMGLQVGQTMRIRNSDGLLHNINSSPTENRPFNVSQPVEMDTDREFRVPEVMIPLRCDVHGWMSAYVGVLDHPYHSVTDTDGSFALETLPPGDYVVEAWHEVYGVLSQEVTVATGETLEISFEFSQEMAGNPVPMADPWIVPHSAHGLR
ncbi:MAG: hypothetical protein RQ751_06745 [Longimicrobiales bacterium]|nr:hypothetical protein [Longimicrobiales bacterium]